MRVPTPSEAAFLAVTAGVAIASSAAIVPDVIEEYSKEVAEHADKHNPANDFNKGFIAGVAAGAGITAKVIHDKVNNP